jgi:hypothetical protein
LFVLGFINPAADPRTDILGSGHGINVFFIPSSHNPPNNPSLLLTIGEKGYRSTSATRHILWIYCFFLPPPDSTSVLRVLPAIVENCHVSLVHDLKATKHLAVAGTVAWITIVPGNLAYAFCANILLHHLLRFLQKGLIPAAGRMYTTVNRKTILHVQIQGFQIGVKWETL